MNIIIKFDVFGKYCIMSVSSSHAMCKAHKFAFDVMWKASVKTDKSS